MSKNEVKYPYFVYLFDKGHYDCQKSPLKNREEFQIIQMGGRGGGIFWMAIIYKIRAMLFILLTCLEIAQRLGFKFKVFRKRS